MSVPLRSVRRPKTERLAGLPAVRVGPERDTGRGGPPLVVVPGLNDPLHSVADSRWYPRLVARYCANYAADRPVYYVSQSREGTTVGDFAAAHGDALAELETRHDRPVALLGLSMGGFLAVEVAAARPGLVDSMVLGLAADRVDRESGRQTLRRWDDHAAAGRFGAVYREATDVVARGVLRVAMRVGGRAYDAVRSPTDPEAFRRAITACLDYDGADTLRSVADDVSALVVGGDGDPFFTDAGFDRAAALADCPRARLVGRAHDAVLSGGAFGRVVRRFLRGRASGPTGSG